MRQSGLIAMSAFSAGIVLLVSTNGSSWRGQIAAAWATIVLIAYKGDAVINHPAAKNSLAARES